MPQTVRSLFLALADEHQQQSYALGACALIQSCLPRRGRNGAAPKLKAVKFVRAIHCESAAYTRLAMWLTVAVAPLPTAAAASSSPGRVFWPWRRLGSSPAVGSSASRPPAATVQHLMREHTRGGLLPYEPFAQLLDDMACTYCCTRALLVQSLVSQWAQAQSVTAVPGQQCGNVLRAQSLRSLTSLECITLEVTPAYDAKHAAMPAPHDQGLVQWQLPGDSLASHAPPMPTSCCRSSANGERENFTTDVELVVPHGRDGAIAPELAEVFHTTCSSIDALGSSSRVTLLYGGATGGTIVARLSTGASDCTAGTAGTLSSVASSAAVDSDTLSVMGSPKGLSTAAVNYLRSTAVPTRSLLPGTHAAAAGKRSVNGVLVASSSSRDSQHGGVARDGTGTRRSNSHRDG